MLEITVKTMDGRNRTFNVDDNTTVKQFKETIASSIEIGADVQRLIYRGRVLTDEKNINDYDVNGKTLHVVQRAPPQTNQPTSNDTGRSSPRLGGRRNGFEMSEGFHIEMIPENGSTTVLSGITSSQNESRKRINHATKMLNATKDVLNGLESSASPGNNTPTTEEKMDTDESSRSQQQESNNTNQQQESQESNNTNQQQQPEDTSNPSTSALADLLDEVLTINERMGGHIRQYRDHLRNEAATTQDVQSIEAACQGTSKAMHLLSHAYHNISDLFCDFNSPAPRTLRTLSLPMRQATTIIQQTIPVQVSAQFNVSPVLRENAATTTTSSAATAQPSATTAPTTASTTTPNAQPFTTSSNSPFNSSSILSEFSRLIGGDIPNFQFPMQGGSNAPNSTQASGLGGRAFQMFMEMGPNGTINTSSTAPDQTPIPPTTTTNSAHPTTGTTPPTTTQESATTGGRSANVTMTSGSTPGFLNEDLIQNIIQVAAGVAMQNGGTQRPQFVMLGPQMGFMGSSGQRGHTTYRRRGSRRNADGSTPAQPTEGSAGTATGVGSPRTEQPRRFREITIDPCLPCSSWHFGHSRAPAAAVPSASTTEPQTGTTTSNVNTESATRTSTSNNATSTSTGGLQHLQNLMGSLQHLMTNIGRTSTTQQNVAAPSMETLFPQVFDMTQHGGTLDGLLRGLGAENSPNEGLLADLIGCLAPHISFSDLLSFATGQSSALRRVRVPLQNFVRDNLLEGRPTTDENVVAAVDKVMGALQQDIREVSEIVQVNHSINFDATVNSYLKSFFTRIIRIIINATDDSVFANELHTSLNDGFHGLVNMSRYCLMDDDRVIEAIAVNRIESMYSDVSPTVVPFVSQWMVQFLRAKLPTIHRSQGSPYMEHIIKKRCSAPVKEVHQVPLVVDMEGDVDSSGSFESASATTLEEKMDEDLTPMTLNSRQQPPMEPFHLATVEGHIPRLSEEVLVRLPPPPMSDVVNFEDELEKDGEDVAWKSVVPKEWVPVIATDTVRQRRQAMEGIREPISDAYLCGIPHKRRRVMIKDRNMHGTAPNNAHLSDLSESIRQAANQVNCQPITSFQDVRSDLETNHSLLSAYREELARNAEDNKQDKIDDSGK